MASWVKETMAVCKGMGMHSRHRDTNRHECGVGGWVNLCLLQMRMVPPVMLGMYMAV
jgi:hypothetical protein